MTKPEPTADLPLEPEVGARVLDAEGVVWRRYPDGWCHLPGCTVRPSGGVVVHGHVDWQNLLAGQGDLYPLGDRISLDDEVEVRADVLPDARVVEIVVGDARAESVGISRHPQGTDPEWWDARGVAGSYRFRAVDVAAATRFGQHLLAAYQARELAIAEAVARFNGGLWAGFDVEGVSDVRDNEPPF